MELNSYENLTPYIAFFLMFFALYTAIYDITSRRRKFIFKFLPNGRKCCGKTVEVQWEKVKLLRKDGSCGAVPA